MFEKISENLYLFRDLCNVYVVKDGDRALLVDFGAGNVLDHLAEIGVSKVEWILHTHHHRDQCQGDYRANELRIPIAVPAHERSYFDEVEVFWGSRQIYDIYDVRQTFNTLARSIDVATALEDYDTFQWGSYEFFIQPTPGHSIGSTTLIGNVDGRCIAFSGDVMNAPGQVAKLYDLQYNYGDFDGMDHLVYSLSKLRKRGIDLMCPSHGQPMDNPNAGMRELEQKLRAYAEHRWGIGKPTTDIRPRDILPHLIMIPGCSNTWIVLSESGRALFVDYGSQSGGFMYSFSIKFEAGNRLRMLEHNLGILREEFGMQSVDVAMPSHYHDDHVNGLPYLQKHENTRIWCYKNMTDILEHPHAYKLGCTYPEPVKIERSLGQGETFRWEEYEFQVFHAPGHADYHMAMFGTIDGKRVGFSGDEIGYMVDGNKYTSNNIWRNHVHATSHEITGKLFLEHAPELTCPGHGGPYEMVESDWRGFHDWCMNEAVHWRGLSCEENLEEAVYNDYVFLYPYQPPCAPGESVNMQVWFENIWDDKRTLEWALNLPNGWTAEPASGQIAVEPGDKGVASFVLNVPTTQNTSYRRLPFTLDATIGAKRYGQLAEAVVDLRPDLDWATGGEARRTSLADE
jgi:glyoxylase-like metal-dependent hydrolase (beta-lactamase superfamily II)